MGNSKPKPFRPVMIKPFKLYIVLIVFIYIINSELVLKKLSLNVKLNRDRRLGKLRTKEK